MSKNRPHPTELKNGDVIASPWGANIRVIQVADVEETTLGEAIKNLNPEKDPNQVAWRVTGYPWFEGTGADTSGDPTHHFIFGGENRMYDRPILLKEAGAEQGLEI